MQHLNFTKVDLQANERRKRNGFGSEIKKDFNEHGNILIDQIDTQIRDSLLIAKDFKFSPYLVVKVCLEESVSLTDNQISKLESMGLKVIDGENKELMVLFADDNELKEFKKALDNYKNGVVAKTKVENEDLFAIIKSVSRWGKDDRRGQDLDNLDAVDYIDCYLWIFDFLEETKEKAKELLDGVKGRYLKYCDKYISQSVAIVRFKINKSDINYFLEHPLIYKIDRIPNYQMKRNERNINKSKNLNDINYNNENLNDNSPSICIIDSGILSGHPLLKESMGDGKTFYLTNDYTPNENDIDGHGTMVAGICEYGIINVDNTFSPSIKLFNAKIHDGIYIGDVTLCLNELKDEKIILTFEQKDLINRYFQREFDIDRLFKDLNISIRKNEIKSIILKYTNIYEKLIPTQMREIVEYFYTNYNCRVFIMVPEIKTFSEHDYNESAILKIRKRVRYMSRTRRNFSAKLKSDLVLELLKGEKDLNTIASENQIQPNLLRNWKKEFIEKASVVFDDSREENLKEKLTMERKEKAAYEKKVGQLTMQVDWLKKKSEELFGSDYESKYSPKPFED